MKKGIQFIEYNGIEGYIELMKRDVEPLNNPECTKIDLLYDGKDIKAVLDYITNLQDRINKAIEYIKSNTDYYSEMCLMGLRDKECEKLLNILKGE